MYCKRNAGRSNEGLVDKKSWNQRGDHCVQCLNTMIRTSHEVVYKLREQEEIIVNGVGVTLECTTLYVCDYITMLMHDIHSHVELRMDIHTMYTPSDVTQPWMELQESPCVDLPEAVKNFIRGNSDKKKLQYGLWSNYSELPITLLPPERTMPQVHSIMNMDEFCAIQRGKQQSLCFRYSNVEGG